MLLRELIASTRRLAFAGLAKNTGKTVALATLLGELAARGETVGVTSIGRDGEAHDAIDARIAKPRIHLRTGSLVATTDALLSASGVAHERIEQTGLLEQVSSGCVLTGGAALMEGMVECAQEILGMPVRLGFPVGVKGIFQLVQGPQYATGVGLVRYGAAQLTEHAQQTEERQGSESAKQMIEVPAGAKGTRIWEWVRAAF